MFNTYRALAMFDLLKPGAALKQQSFYAAAEYRYAAAYFDNPQHFKRFNLFVKYNGKVFLNSVLTLSATTFWRKRDASGQIPKRAVDNGIIGFYGAIDPFEGGLTYRTNANAQLTTSFTNGDIVKNQLYYSNSSFDLHTNFTFFLVDMINGDEIRQKEQRSLVGYNGSYHHTSYHGSIKLLSDVGVNLRADLTGNSALSHTIDRFTTLAQIKLGNISQLDIDPHIIETITF